MVGPRGGSPYVKRGIGRVTKQHNYSTTQQAHHAQAAASAYQQQQHAAQQSGETVNIGGGKFGDDGDEAGGMGDELDLMSLRDAAMVRYVRYNEWMELITGTAVSTDRFKPSLKETREAEDEAEMLYIKPILDRQTDESEKKSLSEGLSEKALFFKKLTEKLREEFSAPPKEDQSSTDGKGETEVELYEKYQLEVISKFKIKAICSSSTKSPSKTSSTDNGITSINDGMELDGNMMQNDLPDTSMQFQQYPDTTQPDISMDSTGFNDSMNGTPGDGLLRDSSLSVDRNDLDPDAFISLGGDNDSASNSALDLLDIPPGMD